MPPFVYDETVPDLETLMHERAQELVDIGIPMSTNSCALSCIKVSKSGTVSS